MIHGLMSMLQLRTLTATFILTMGLVPAFPAVVTVDPDAVAAGTNISSAFAGVALSAVSGGFGAGPSIFAVNPSTQPSEPFTASTGLLSFGNSGTFPHVFREPGFLSLRVDFASPTSFVAIDYISNDPADTGFLRVFNASNTLLGTYTTASLSTNAFESMSFTSGGSDIAYILAGGLNGSSSGGLDNLRYESAAIPEPSTVLLISGGLLGLAARRRRKA